MANVFDIARLITNVGIERVKIKQEPGVPEKSSNEILTELFSTFNADADADADDGVASAESSDQQTQNDDNDAAKSIKLQTKKKKSKKRHKHKEKKHKKKSRHNSTDSNSDVEGSLICSIYYLTLYVIIANYSLFFILTRWQKEKET